MVRLRRPPLAVLGIGWFITALLCPQAAAEPSVLGPESAAKAASLHAALAAHTGLALEAPSIQETGLVFQVTGTDENFRLKAPGAGGVTTTHGSLFVPASFPVDRIVGLVRALEGIRPPLVWKKLGVGESPQTYAVDGPLARALADARLRSVALRSGQDTAGSDLAPDLAATRFRFHRWLTSSASEAGDPGWPSLRQAIVTFPRSEPGAFGAREQIRGAPKLWAMAALAAAAQGEPHRALAFADVATRFGVADEDAFRVWERLTGVARAQSSAVVEPMNKSLTADGQLPILPLVLLLVGLVLWLAWARTFSLRRFAFAMAAAAFAFFCFAQASQRDALIPNAGMAPSLPDQLVAPLAGGPCLADPPLWDSHGYTIFATCEGAQVAFEISRRGEGVVVRALGEDVGPVAEAARTRLRRLFEEAITEGWKLAERPDDRGHAAQLGRFRSGADRFELGVSAGLAGLSLFMFFIILVGLWRVARARLGVDPFLRRGVIIVFALVLAAHLLVESRMVMVYTGYDLTGRLALLDEVPRYGAGTLWIYRPAFLLFGIDHASVQLLNRLFGILLILPTLVLVLCAAPRARLAPVFAAALVGLLPVFLRDQTSEAIQAGTCFVLLLGLSGWALSLRRRGDPWLALCSVPILALGATCRPEAGLALACVAIGLLLARRASWRDRWLFWASLGGIALLWVLPHIEWLLGVVGELLQAQDISPVDELSLERVARVFMEDNIFLSARWVPWIVPLLALFAFRWRSNIPAIAGWWLGALAWLALSSVDLPDVSVPRVHLPVLLLIVPPAAIGLAMLRSRRRLALLLVGATAIWAMVASPSVLAPTNGDAEEELIRAVEADVAGREGRTCVARLGVADPPPPGRTPRYFPDYLFEGSLHLSLSDIEGSRERCAGGTWFVLGTRCYMRDAESSTGGGEGRLALCDDIRARLGAEALLELNVTHRPESTLPMYPQVDRLQIGAYRLVSPP